MKCIVQKMTREYYSLLQQQQLLLLAELAQGERVVARAHLVALVLRLPPLEVRDLLVQTPPLILHHALLISNSRLKQ